MKYGVDVGQNWKFVWAGAAGFVVIALLLFFLSNYVVDPRGDARLIDRPAEPGAGEFGQTGQFAEPEADLQTGASVGTSSMRIRVGPNRYVYVYNT